MRPLQVPNSQTTKSELWSNHHIIGITIVEQTRTTCLTNCTFKYIHTTSNGVMQIIHLVTRSHHQDGFPWCFFSKGFKVGNLDIVVSHLQYADAPVFIGEACVENFRCMKSIHRWFQLVSSLKVNSSTNKLIGVNNPYSLSWYQDFLRKLHFSWQKMLTPNWIDESTPAWLKPRCVLYQCYFIHKSQQYVKRVNYTPSSQRYLNYTPLPFYSKYIRKHFTPLSYEKLDRVSFFTIFYWTIKLEPT